MLPRETIKMSSSSKNNNAKINNKQRPKSRYSNKTFRRQPAAAQSAIQNGSGSIEVTSSQSKYFSDDPLDWDDKQKDFEADLAAEHQHVLEYIRGTYHFADRYTVSREVGVLGDLNYRPALKLTQAEYDQMPSADRYSHIGLVCITRGLRRVNEIT